MNMFDTNAIRTELYDALHGEDCTNEKLAIYAGSNTAGALLRLTPRDGKGVVPTPDCYILDSVAGEKTINGKPVIDFKTAHEMCQFYQIMMFSTSYKQMNHMIEQLRNDPIEGVQSQTVEAYIYKKNANTILSVYDELEADIEGFEWRMLTGARRIIKRDRPKLAICLYHNFSDIFNIPKMIKRFCPDYKIYIRHHAYGTYETVLYACVD